MTTLKGGFIMNNLASAKQKTVCFFSGDITRCGGTERVSIKIADLLKRQGRARIIFLSLTESAAEPFFSMDDGISRYKLEDAWINPGPGYIKILPKLRKFLKEQDVDIIIDIDIVLDCLSLPASKGLKTKVISWEHFNYQFEQSVMYRRLILKYSIKRSDYVVTLTERDKELYIQHLKRRERIQAIYNPIEESVAAQEEKKEKWIITIGRHVPQKGPEYLVETAERVLKKYLDWKWIVLGDGEMREYLENEISRRQLDGRLILEGIVQNVGDYLQKAQIYVMTSRFEGLGLCLLEAKSHGLPCVAFDVPMGPAELIADGINGYLIPPFFCDEMEDKISRLIDNKELRDQFSGNAMLGMEKYREDYILNQWNQVIDQM